MAKKRKTKQEKIISDLRRQLQTQPEEQQAATPTLYSLPKKVTVTPLSPVNREPKTQSYSYVISDLKKTIFLTAIAISAQIALHFVLMR